MVLRLPRRGYALDVELRIEADLDLEGLESSGDGPFDLVGDLFRRFGTHPVARFHAVAVSTADQVVDGLVGRFADNVPQRLVDGSSDIQCGRGARVEQVADFGGDLTGQVHAPFDRVDVVRVAADESGLDLFEEALITAGPDAGLSDARDPFIGIDEDDGLDGCEPGAVPHGNRLMLPQRRERDTDIPRADVGDFHGVKSDELSLDASCTLRGGNSSSIPPIGSTMARIFRISSLLYFGSAPNACVKISTVSRSTVRPFVDADGHPRRTVNAALPR